MKDYIKLYDCAIDGQGNLYVYAMEIEYDAFLTKKDMIKKYDKSGVFIKDIFVLDYTGSEDRPHTFAQFGSLRCEDGILTFSRVKQDMVTLYRYDTFRDILETAVFNEGVSDYSVARLAVNDLDNFIYSTRNGNIYEVKQGGMPVLRASCDFTIEKNGVIPWYLDYDAMGNILFFDMASGTICRIRKDGVVDKPVPDVFFEELHDKGESPLLTIFGFQEGVFTGVYGETVWRYDGDVFQTYSEKVTISMSERMTVIGVQVAFIIGVLAFLLGVCVLFIFILDRYVSLFIKQIIIIIPITIVAFISFYNLTFSIMEKRLNNEIFKELNMAASISANLIDESAFDNLQSLKDFGGDSYKKLSATLKQIVRNNADEWSKLYYTAIYKGTGFEYCMLISNDEAGMFRPAGYLTEESPEYSLLKEGKSFADISDLFDGKWAYSEAGLFNSKGELIGVLEIGLDMVSYQLGNIALQERVSFIGALICLVILIVLIIVTAIIVNNLVRIVNVLSTITKGNYGVRVNYRGRDELGKVSSGLNVMVQELQRQFAYITSLNEASSRFVPVKFMEHLGVPDITKMKLGDHVQRDLTILFFDIRSFSINSEMMSARENFLFINKVLGIAGPILRQYNGFVDKYMGDAAMVLFDDAYDAVQAGIELYRQLILDKTTKVHIGGDGISIGIGIHSGSVMMGLVGENERLSGTVISKNVNLASRMETLTKQTHSGMLITRDTLNQIGDRRDSLNFRFIGMVQAAGVNEVIGVIDVLDALPELICRKRLVSKNVFESGIRKYHTKDYKGAYERFKQVVKFDVDDICAQIYLEQTEKHLENPNLPSVFIFDRK
ncbi:MAG: adenylate/guanylate cyclase domain-containing protein [Treponema sp.]|nr:adenylate/guanylate cyclase domain-containing protein [Treponema sp.]